MQAFFFKKLIHVHGSLIKMLFYFVTLFTSCKKTGRIEQTVSIKLFNIEAHKK